MELSYPYTPLYYNEPTQIRYYDIESKVWHGAIAYHDYLIDSRIGEKIDISSIINQAKENGIDFEAAIVELSWVNLDEIILRGY